MRGLILKASLQQWTTVATDLPANGGPSRLARQWGSFTITSAEGHPEVIVNP
jgi:hypothetical protein